MNIICNKCKRNRKCIHISIYMTYRISSNKCCSSNKRRPLISAAPLGIHIEISASL